MIVNGNIKMNKFPPIKASTHNNNYTLLESIDIPEKVGVEEVRHIGKVLEQALPNGGDSPKLGHMRLSPNIIEKCTESPLARKALVWSNSFVKLQFALYVSPIF